VLYIIKEINKLNILGSDPRVDKYFKSIGQKYNNKSKLSTICQKLDVHQNRDLYRALTQTIEESQLPTYKDLENQKNDIKNKICEIESDEDFVKVVNYLNEINYIIDPNNNAIDVICDDLTYDQLLGLYKAIYGIDYNPNPTTGGSLRPTEKQIHKKYFIDRHKLNNNVLELRYNKNRHLTNVKSQVIGHGVKKILNQIIDHDYIDTSNYHQITEDEQHLIRTILHKLDSNHLIGSANDQFNDKYQILLGSYNAGNNSEQLRSQLKQYIIQAMKLNMITRTTGQQMLLKMCI
jgi:hypothetical protein